ncbi:AlkA N-terminal domain-containing protein [Actinokineospora spheciospongiae]|uniref:AlkA N-terminal domain-containing protein n=1 Tax=Actinokineospora spheciospongiae TaxID=909613 RepID=UPI000D714697|nr:AlkA N-terminal domain-containing protein [Actinokineospora spheciospongiae]PWW65426.1 DNA-3-methyladenine glycosylase II [Actinokineospora spheciospongiae]
MLIDPELAHRAAAVRDTRFDGQLILAVRTTGVYCRPACPAATARRRTAEFFPTAAAAQQQGYRACLRCLPDVVPGSPEWNTRGDLAGRAMRLILDGVIEREGVPGLARRVGYSERHLTRVLTAELGAGPLALARAQRAHLARLLIETTALTVSDVAFASGFASVRQFNDTVRSVFAATPSELRTAASRRVGRRRHPATPGRVTLRLPVRTPFDAAGILAFLGARAIPGVESASPGRYARTLRLPHGPATAHLRPAGTHVECTLRLADLRDLGTAVARLRRLFDLDADPTAIDRVLAADPALAPSVAAIPGIRVPGSVDGTETVLRALLGQQLTVSAARAAARRLSDSVGEPLPAPDGELTTLFPSAAAVAERGAEVLAGPTRRVDTIRAVCAAIASGELELHVGVDPETLRSRLQSYPGIGPSTAGYVVMRLLGEPDILPPNDIAVRTGAGPAMSTSDDSGDRGRLWSPWRSYAGMHLWRATARATPEP